MLFLTETSKTKSFGDLASKSFRARALVSLLVVMTAAVTACTGEPLVEPGASVINASTYYSRASVFLDQGWDAATRDAFYQTTEGSRMLPYNWFVNLEQAGSGSLLRSPENMRRMGYLVDEASGSNPDQLPVGFARDVDPVRGDAVGLSCAACHTGEIHFAGTRIRIDGGQSFGDLEQLQQGILGSLDATLAAQPKFERFAKAILGLGASVQDKDALRAKLGTARAGMAARIERNRGQIPHGPTRTDALSVIGNEILCELFQDPRNCVAAVAPVQFPPLWNTSDFEWVQYSSSVHSPLARNIGQSTATFAEASLDLTSPLGQAGLLVNSSTNVENLHRLETWVKALRSPAWPADIFGSIDSERAAEGAALYASTCAGCHDPNPARTAPNRFGKTFARVDFSTPLFPGPAGEIPPQGLLGTDPTAAISFITRRAFPGPFATLASVSAQLGPDGKAPASVLMGLSGRMTIERFFAINGLNDAQKIELLDFRESLTPTTAQVSTYKARPLNGIVFTAPYLHNGSVASLYELLLPPAERLTEFYVGSKEFDPVHVGFSTCAEEGVALFDTTAAGNGNGGHVWGTNLGDDERMALIEYLKTL